MALSPEQKKIANLILSIGSKMGASPMEKLAAIETGLVESGLSNPSGGTGDSSGWRQERASEYADPTNLTHSITRFFQETKAVRGKYKTAGDLAAAVQRPAEQYRGRYQNNRDAALNVISELTGQPAQAALHMKTVTKVTRPGKTTVGATQGDLSALLPLLQASLKRPSAPAVSMPDPSGLPNLQFAAPAVEMAPPPQQDSGGSIDDLLSAITQLSGPSVNVSTGPSSTTTTVTGGKRISQGGESFQSSHSPLKELFWQGSGGIDVKNGKVIPQGSVSGHTDHVHVAAGPKTVVALAKLAQQMGLNVGENPHFGGVHPVHVPGSYHYKGEAIDVSGDPRKERAFARKVAKLYGLV